MSPPPPQVSGATHRPQCRSTPQSSTRSPQFNPKHTSLARQGRLLEETPALVAEDVAALVAEDVAALVAEDVAALVAEDVAALVAEDVALLVAEDVAALVAVEVAALVAEDVAPLVAEDVPVLREEDTTRMPLDARLLEEREKALLPMDVAPLDEDAVKDAELASDVAAPLEFLGVEVAASWLEDVVSPGSWPVVHTPSTHARPWLQSSLVAHLDSGSRSPQAVPRQATRMKAALEVVMQHPSK